MRQWLQQQHQAGARGTNEVTPQLLLKNGKAFTIQALKGMRNKIEMIAKTIKVKREQNAMESSSQMESCYTEINQ